MEKMTPQRIIGEIVFWLVVISLISIGTYALFFMK